MFSPQRQHAVEKVCAGRMARFQDYFEVPTELFFDNLDLGMPDLPEVDFYHLESDRPVLLRRGDQPFPAMALKMRSKVLVHHKEIEIVRRYAESLMISPKRAAASPDQRMSSLRRSAMLVVEDVFDNPTPENINRGVKVVNSFVYVLMKEPKSYSLLSGLSSHDPYTLQHSVGTAVNALILARKIGVKSESELMEAGLGGLFHDLGKVKVRKEVINKPGPLDEIEWEEMKTHPMEGFRIVESNPNIADRTKRAILEHHEDNHGQGYPRGLTPDKTDIFSKIVCISDVYNALTTSRSYSNARPPFEAFQLMKEKLKHKIDEALFKELVMIYGGKIT